jgi:hypothetical protein
LLVVACRPAHVHRPTLTLPSLVDCCFFTPTADRGGGWGHHLPLLFSGLVQLPLVVAPKMRRGAAELRPPRRLSLRSRAANFCQPLCQAHVQLEQRAGGVGGQACLCLVRFPSRRPWFQIVFVWVCGSLYIVERA